MGQASGLGPGMNSEPAENVVGSTLPRLWTPPLMDGPAGPCGCGCALSPDADVSTGRYSYGFEVVEFANRILGMPLDPWERFIAIHGGELLPDGTPRFRKLLIIVARQNGKTHLLVVLSLFWLHIERVAMVLGTSTNIVYAKESWEKACQIAQDIPEIAEEIPKRGGIRETNGEQTLTMVTAADDGSGRTIRARYKIAAANRRGGRSLTVHRYVADELREHDSWDAWNAAYNAMNAVLDAQAWAISNQGDDRAVVLNSLRNDVIDEDGRMRPVEDVDPQIGLFEYSCEPHDDPEDLYALAKSNPNLGRRVSAKTLLSEARSAKREGGERLTGFRTEIMCIREAVLDPAIDQAAWPDCRDDGFDDDWTAHRGRVVICFDVSMDGLHATAYAATLLDDGRVRIGAVGAWDGMHCTAELRRDLPDLVAAIRPRKVGWFPNGPAASVAAGVKRRPRVWPPRGTRLEEIKGEATAVCMGFAEQVRTRAIAHSDDPLLNAQQGMTEKSWRGDGWVFTRRGAGHCDATYAAAGAVHVARTTPVRRRAEAESEEEAE